MIISERLKNLCDNFHEKKLAHAFLLETNDFDSCYKDVINLVKVFNEGFSSNINKMIDSDSLPSLITINPVGMNIKKEQILEMMKKFSLIPVYSYYNIYIINNAEKLNDSSANCLLKFIEEPNENTFGFFITDNSERVINTIKSRCQLIKVDYNIQDKETNEEFMELINSIFKEEYIDLYSLRKDYMDRKYLEENFSYLLEVIEKYHSNLYISINDYQYPFLKKLNLNNIKEIIDCIVDVLYMLINNVNIDLIWDLFIIKVEEIR